MRYKMVPLSSGMGWVIWDNELSPALFEQGVRPWHCSLDGELALTFDYMSQGYRWLAECEKAGLDMGGEGTAVHVYSSPEGGAVRLNHPPAGGSIMDRGPVIRDHTLP